MADDISIIVDSSDVVKASKDVGNLEANVGKLGNTTKKSAAPALERGIKGINQFGKVASTSGKDMNRFNMVLQQGGYQLQDFIVQLQGGTSFFTAFSQQGSQFAGIFGPAGAVFGAVIALGSAIGGLSFALLKGQQDSRSLQETLDDLTTSVLEYSKAMDAAKDASAAATKEFGFTSSVLQKIIQDFKTLAEIKVFEDLGASIEKLRGEHINGWESDIENIKDLLRLEGAFAAGGEEVAQFDGLLKNLENSSLSLGERISSAMSLKDILLENSGGIQNMEEDQRAFYESLLTTIQQMEVLRGLISNGDSNASEKRNANIENMVQVFRDAQKRIRDEAALDAAGDKAILKAQAKAEKALFDENAAYEKRVAREVAAAKKREADLDAAGDKAILEAQARAEKELFEQNAKYAREQAAAAKATSEEIAQGYQNSIGLSQTLNNEINSYVESAAEGFKQSEALKEELGEAAFEALRLAGVDIASGISAAHAAAAAMAAELNISLAAAMGIRAMAADEDAVMSQPVVQGKATDRYGVKDLKRFGYTEEYLKSIGKIKTKSGGGGGGKTVVDINEIIEARKKQAEQERVLIGLSGEQEAAQRTYYDLLKQNEKADIKLTDTELKGAAAAIAAYEEQNRVLEEAVQIQDDIASSIANNFGDAFMSIVDGTKTAKEAFKDMARAIIKDLFRILVVEQMVKSIKGFLGGGFSLGTTQANGGAWQGGSQIQAYANGGVVGGPTYFPMAGGKTGLMGEAGPEAIMPLKRGANGKLGVQAEGGSGGVTVVQNNTFGSGVTRAEVNAMLPKMVEATKAAVADAKLRGGSYGGAFA